MNNVQEMILRQLADTNDLLLLQIELMVAVHGDDMTDSRFGQRIAVIKERRRKEAEIEHIKRIVNGTGILG